MNNWNWSINDDGSLAIEVVIPNRPTVVLQMGEQVIRDSLTEDMQTIAHTDDLDEVDELVADWENFRNFLRDIQALIDAELGEVPTR